MQRFKFAALGSVKEAKIAHFDKAIRQDMLQEALDEAFDRKGMSFEMPDIRSAVLERDQRSFDAFAMFDGKQAAVADGNAVDLGSQVFKSGLTIADRFAVNHPIFAPN